LPECFFFRLRRISLDFISANVYYDKKMQEGSHEAKTSDMGDRSRERDVPVSVSPASFCSRQNGKASDSGLRVTCHGKQGKFYPGKDSWREGISGEPVYAYGRRNF